MLDAETKQPATERPLARLMQWGPRLLEHAGRSGSVQAALALIDQLMVSGNNFVTLLLLGRLAGPNELGTFALVMSLYYFVLAVQESLITVPYTIFGVRLSSARRRQYSGEALYQSMAWSACISVLLVLAAAATLLAGKEGALVRAVGVFGLVSPFFLLREFSRRYLFAHLQVAKVVTMTITQSVVQLVVLSVLAFSRELSAATALVAIGVGSGVPACTWLWANRQAFSAGSHRRKYFLRKNWLLGRWLLATQATPLLAGNILFWLILAILGPTALGVYYACDAIIRFANPIIVAFTSILTPRVAIGFREGGHERLRAIVWKSNALLGVLLLGFVLMTVVAGDWIMFHSFGDQYKGAWAALVVLAINQLVTKMAIAPERALFVLECANLALAAEAVGLVLELGTAPLLLKSFGIVGGPSAMLIGSLASTCLGIGFYMIATHEGKKQRLPQLEPLAASVLPVGGVSE